MLRTKLKALIATVLLVLFSSAVALAQDGPVQFSLRSIDSQTITSDSLRGEVVVLGFGASWLPLSRTQLQGVKKLADEYSAGGWSSTGSAPNGRSKIEESRLG